MFRVGQEYFNEAGLKARVISNDADLRTSVTAPVCNVIAVVTNKAGGQTLNYFSDDGRYAGMTGAEYAKYRLISDEPTSEEAVLITDILSLADVEGDRREESLLKIIRRLRTK